MSKANSVNEVKYMEQGQYNKRLRVDVSVDCVVLGFDNEQLNVLLVERNGESTEGMRELKLPGNLINDNEDIDDAAHRVLLELTGIQRMKLKQFKCFGSPQRTSNQDDVKWLENTSQLEIGRLVTIAYLSLCKINRKLHSSVARYKSVIWCPVNTLPRLPFDHNQIVQEALQEVGNWIEREPALAAELLPAKFTASQLRGLYEAVYNRQYEARNFHKKIATMPQVVALNEKQEGVSHRAARYYKFKKG